MEQEKISALQLFYVMVGFEVGNTMLFALGPSAKQDAWLAILFSMLGGLILMWVYTKLFDYYPNDTLVQMIPKIVGRFLSYPLIIGYFLYFSFLACTACRDFSELISSVILTDTPMVVIVGGFMILIVYCLRGGVEAFGRMGEIVFPIYTIVLIILWILMLMGGQVDSKQLTPVLGEGIKPVLKEIGPSPSILSFPFGETVIITMFFPALNNKRNSRKVGMAVILVGGILLTINSLIVLSILGPDIYGKEFFPLLTAARMVSIADFLERFDALVILMMVAGVFFKIGGWTYGASTIITQLCKLKNNGSILIPLGTIITFFSLIYINSLVEQVELGEKFTAFYLHIPLQMVLPILLLGIACIRKKFQS